MNRFQSWYSAQPRALRALLTINVVVYVAWVVLFAHIAATRAFVFDHLALNTNLPGAFFEPWQFVTYNFLHLGSLSHPGLSFGSLLHIAFNMLWLYWIGREHEEMHGPHSLVALYLLTGVGAGLFTMLLHVIFPTVTLFGGIIHGASAAVLGVMMAVAVMYPYKKIGLLLIGTVRLIWVVVAFLVIDVLFMAGGGTAVGAHLGGALCGFLFVKVEQKGLDLSSWARIFFRDRRKRQKVTVPEDAGWLDRMEAWLASRSHRKGEAKHSKSTIAKIRSMRSTADPEPEAIETEVDRILEKISQHGMEALTDEEKRILYDASRR